MNIVLSYLKGKSLPIAIRAYSKDKTVDQNKLVRFYESLGFIVQEEDSTGILLWIK